uniref:Protein NATD1 n=1 Tax=Crassostrea virginica TaxID=6565 RepID=A0A8B8CQV9_CRAVI|nr:protein NATD1-like [Crassostrea virginica]
MNRSVLRPYFAQQLIRRHLTTMDSASKFQTVHDPDKKEFVIQLKGDKNSDKAFLQYDYISSNKVDLYHTLVPPAYRGHGIAAILAETAFKHFKENGIEMELTCSYLQHYASKHPPS